jgi:hypothetical protein
MDGLIPVVFAEIESKFCIFTGTTYIRSGLAARTDQRINEVLQVQSMLTVGKR